MTGRASAQRRGWPDKRRVAADRWRSTNLRRTIARLAFPYTRPGSLWDASPRFRELGNLGEYRTGLRAWRRMHESGSTMMGCRRGRTLHRLAAEVERRRIVGSIVDCGVGNGGSTAILANGARTRTVWAFDSFEPSPGPDDDLVVGRSGYSGRLYPPGSEARARETVGLIADPARLCIVNGWVDRTYVQCRDDVGPVAVLHIDLESYEATRLTLETFYRAVAPGGYVVVNCYGNWPEVGCATEDFRLASAVSARLVRVDHAGVYWRKS